MESAFYTVYCPDAEHSPTSGDDADGREHRRPTDGAEGSSGEESRPDRNGGLAESVGKGDAVPPASPAPPQPSFKLTLYKKGSKLRPAKPTSGGHAALNGDRRRAPMPQVSAVPEDLEVRPHDVPPGHRRVASDRGLWPVERSLKRIWSDGASTLGGWVQPLRGNREDSALRELSYVPLAELSYDAKDESRD